MVMAFLGDVDSYDGISQKLYSSMAFLRYRRFCFVLSELCCVESPACSCIRTGMASVKLGRVCLLSKKKEEKKR
jgi:hypothetical protein